jgi:serine/threonine protein kinase
MIEPGHRIGRYEVQRRLGRGGMGTVYLAHDTLLRRLVAIKLFLGELDVPEAHERFVREARSAAGLNHANIVTIHDFGELDSQPYIVMEYVLGETLAEKISRKPLVPLLEKLRWMDDLCAGVAYAHEAGILHRDIKPSNLMIDRSGRLKVLDFGIARPLGTLATSRSAFAGTPGYMAPEQILGLTVDERSDLFSIGVVCYVLISYIEAFPGDTVPTVTHRVLNERPPSLATILPGIDPELAAVVERALEKSVADRFPQAKTMRQALDRVRRRLELCGGEVPTIARVARAASPADNGEGGSVGLSARSGSDVALATPPPDPRPGPGQLQTPGLAAAGQRSSHDASARAKRDKVRRGDDGAAAPDGEENTGYEAVTVIAPVRRACAPRPPTARTHTPPPEVPPPSDDRARAQISDKENTPLPPVGNGGMRRPWPGAVAVGSLTRGLRGRRLTASIGAVVAIVLLLATAAAVRFRPGASVAHDGIVAIDAVPWGTVTAILSADGRAQRLPSDASTPLLVELPAGTYEVTVAGPSRGFESQQIRVDVISSAFTSAPIVRFTSITAEEYFEQYLSPEREQASDAIGRTRADSGKIPVPRNQP